MQEIVRISRAIARQGKRRQRRWGFETKVGTLDRLQAEAADLACTRWLGPETTVVDGAIRAKPRSRATGPTRDHNADTIGSATADRIDSVVEHVDVAAKQSASRVAQQCEILGPISPS